MKVQPSPLGSRRALSWSSSILALGLVLTISLGAVPISLAGQHTGAIMEAHHPQIEGDNEAWGANWKLAARWAPYKSRSLTYSTSVSPRWIGETDRFWYVIADGDFDS